MQAPAWVKRALLVEVDFRGGWPRRGFCRRVNGALGKAVENAVQDARARGDCCINRLAWPRLTYCG